MIRCRLPSEPYVPLSTIYCCLLWSVTIDSSAYYVMAVAGLRFSYGMFVHRLTFRAFRAYAKNVSSASS